MIGKLIARGNRRLTRRRGKESREQVAAAVGLVLASPIFAVAAAAIKLEGLIDANARGPVFYREDRISRGEVFKLLKFRILTRRALESLGPGPTHIKSLETQDEVTRVGRVLHRWYLDELPQLWNIVRGDMFLIGTRPWPIAPYEEELATGITRKRDMPAGLIGPVQAAKGQETDVLQLDLDYWEAYQTLPALKLLWLDLKIILRSAKVQLEHKGL